MLVPECPILVLYRWSRCTRSVLFLYVYVDYLYMNTSAITRTNIPVQYVPSVLEYGSRNAISILEYVQVYTVTLPAWVSCLYRIVALINAEQIERVFPKRCDNDET